MQTRRGRWGRLLLEYEASRVSADDLSCVRIVIILVVKDRGKSSLLYTNLCATVKTIKLTLKTAKKAKKRRDNWMRSN